MTSPFPVEVDEKVRRSVGDQRRVAEVGRGVDHGQQLDDSAHLVEVADGPFQVGEQVQHGLTGAVVALLHGDIPAELADVQQSAAGQARTGAGQVDQVAGPHKGDDVASAGRAGWRQFVSQFLQLVLNLRHDATPARFNGGTNRKPAPHRCQL